MLSLGTRVGVHVKRQVWRRYEHFYLVTMLTDMTFCPGLYHIDVDAWYRDTGNLKLTLCNVNIQYSEFATTGFTTN